MIILAAVLLLALQGSLALKNGVGIKTVSETPTIRPTRIPTSTPTSPTEIPTSAPTLDYVDISINAYIYLHNVTISVLDETCQNSIVEAVANTLSLDVESVSFESQTFITQERRRRLTTYYEMFVSVKIWTSTRDYSDSANQNASYLYNKVITLLNYAIESGEFSSTIRSVSDDNNTPGTQNVFVNRTATSDYTIVTQTVDSRRSSQQLTDGDFAGILVSSFVGMFLVVSGFYYYVTSHKSGSNRGSKEYEAAHQIYEEHDTVVTLFNNPTTTSVV